MGENKRFGALVLSFAVVMLAACDRTAESTAATADAPPGESEEAPVPDPIMNSPLAGTWQLVELDGAPVPDGLSQPITLEFTEEGVGGYSGVNRFRMAATVDESAGTLSFGTGMSTMMAGPPEAMSFESTYLAALGAVEQYTVEGGRLTLSEGEQPRLVYARSP